jgi:nucleotide-binding universal stress UspA family protein
MYRYRRLLVGLNLGEEDKTIIRYASMVNRLAKSEKICFIHVAETLDIPKELLEEYPELLHPVDEFAENQMKEMVQQHFDRDSDAEVVNEVVQGSPLAELLRWAQSKEIDLILVGRKRQRKEIGTLPEKLARKAPCSVLIVPGGTEAKITKIVAPVDFSDNSADAMDAAIAFASAAGITNILCPHVYGFSLGFASTGITPKKFASILKKQLQKDHQNFISRLDFKGISPTAIFLPESDPSRAISKLAKKQGADLLVIGTRGRSAEAVLLGSVVERLIHTADIPLIAVKKKGTGSSFLTALLRKL